MTTRSALPIPASGLLLLALLVPQSSIAQSPLSLGIGFNSVLSTAQGLGIGFRGRVARPINNDLAFAAGMGITGFVLGGRDDADYLFDPQASLIVTLGGDRPDRAAYVLGGLGAYIPVGGGHDDRGGPSLHVGMGWVRGLYDSRLFYEVDPGIVIGESRIDLYIPFRIGVIF